MNTDLKIFNPKNSEICNSSSFTELRISTLQEPILENYVIENLNPNIMNKKKIILLKMIYINPNPIHKIHYFLQK